MAQQELYWNSLTKPITLRRRSARQIQAIDAWQDARFDHTWRWFLYSTALPYSWFTRYMYLFVFWTHLNTDSKNNCPTTNAWSAYSPQREASGFIVTASSQSSSLVTQSCCVSVGISGNSWHSCNLGRTFHISCPLGIWFCRTMVGWESNLQNRRNDRLVWVPGKVLIHPIHCRIPQEEEKKEQNWKLNPFVLK